VLEVLTNTYTRWQLPTTGGSAAAAIELDMGCGNGGFLLQLAERFPQRIFLGSDVMLGRLRRLEAKIERRGLHNIRLLRAESRQLIGFQLPPRCLQRVHLLCPDPWPKTRHRGRRLLTTDFFTRLQRVLVADATLHIATDEPAYWQAQLQILQQLPFFVPAPERLAEIADLQTDFERRWRAQGKSVPHATYRFLPLTAESRDPVRHFPRA